MRTELEPELAPAPDTTAAADKPTPDPAPRDEKPLPARSTAKTSTTSADLLDIIIKAKKSVKRSSPKQAAAPRKKKQPKQDNPSPDATPTQARDAKKYFQDAAPLKTPAVGSKRGVDGLEKQQHASADSKDEEDNSSKFKDPSIGMQPPTRQQRNSTGACIDSKKLDTPRAKNRFVLEHVRPLARKPRTGQLTMTTFMPKLEVGESAPSGEEVELVGHKAALHPTIKLPRLLDAIEMTEVKTPANGSCWKYALVIVQAYECGPEVTTAMKRDVAAATKLGRKVNNKLAAKVKGMIADGTVDLVHLCSTVIGRVVQHDSLKQLQDHFVDAGKQPADENIHRKYWGGEPEFKVFVEWIKAPLYVIDVMPDGTCYPQWYHITDVRSKDGSTVQRAIVTGVTEAAFRSHMSIYKRNHVAPLVLLLHHSSNGKTPVGHFTAARVSNATYKHWAGSKRRQADMTVRLQKVERELRGVDSDLSQHPFLSPSPPATPGSGSLYEPTDGDSTMEDASRTADAATPAAPPAPTPGDTSGTEQPSTPSFQLLAPRSTPPWPMSVLSALSLDSQPAFGTATLDKLLPVSFAAPTSMPFGEREEALIKRLQDQPPYDPETTRQIKQVYNSNNTAYENWKARQKKDDPATYALVRGISGPIHACTELQDNIGGFVQLVHSLPYPEVHMATVPEGVLLKVGQAASCLGQAQMLHRVQAHLVTSSQAFCSTWIDALVADTTPPETRWQLSQATDRWKRLEQAAATTQVVLPARSRHGVPDAAWFKMLAYVLAVPGCLPWVFSERPLPQRCDALAAWFAMTEQAQIAHRTAEAIDQRRWLAAREIFPSGDYGDTASDLPAHSYRSTLGDEAPPRHDTGETSNVHGDTKVQRGTSKTTATTESGKKHGKHRAAGRSRGVSMEEKHIVCLTQNVMGFLKEDSAIDDWFNGLRGATDFGMIDIVLLQETRATDRWKDRLKRKYAAGWGKRAEEQFEQWSHWGPTPEPVGGVAILVRPNGRVQNPRPLWETHWSQWFMAIQFEVEGVSHTLVNVYAPTNTAQREAIFTKWAEHPKPAGRLMVGCDFNCTLDDSMDRSYSTQHSHDSVALHQLLQAWDLQDTRHVEQDQIHTEADRREFHATAHTYRYRVGETAFATSRLDRFYVDKRHVQHARRTQVVTSVSTSDHDGVIVVYADQRRPPPPSHCKKRPRLRYPLPFGTSEIVTEITVQHIEQFKREQAAAPAVNAGQWVTWKVRVRTSCHRGIRISIKKQTRAYRQRRRRLRKALRALKSYTGRAGHTVSGTVEGITKGMEGLTINGYARAKAIRAELIRISQTRSRRRQHKRFSSYKKGHKDAERLFFLRFRLRQGTGVLETASTDDGSAIKPANRVANGWVTVTQRGDRPRARRDRFFASLSRPEALPDLSGLDAEFTEEEVRQAIRSCPRQKAPGPDGLPNDWYRDHEDDLAELLTHLYNGWHSTGILPASFKKALVACIPKTSKPKTGLDFRPIALLDSDYKIYAQLLLNRVRPFLPKLVSETQFGFVPGRQVHDALDVFHALQALVNDGLAPATALAVSLDFAKAYDTLDRPFLLQVLQRLGFPPRFIQAVRQMHLATTAEYMAEGDISDEQRVLNGIRQGCPLAPTLFVLAVDTLYQAVREHPELHGIRLPSGDEVRVAGFADDTMMYISDAAVMPHMLELLGLFEDASGLGINVQKCVTIALHEYERPSGELALPLAAAGDMTRLLGGQVSSAKLLAKVWDLTIQQMRTRLRLAEEKTTNVLQRVKLVKAILVPKFTFVARQHWPTGAQVGKVQHLIKNFVWKGTLAVDPIPGRAWMGEDTAALPVADGGLGMPVLTHVLQELSVQVLARWATPNKGIPSEVGRTRLRHHRTQDGHTLLSRKAARKATLQATLISTGMQKRHALDSQPREPDETALVLELLQATGRGTSEQYQWADGRLCATYDHHRSRMAPLLRLQAARYGTLHVAALLSAPIFGEDILLGPDGEPLRSSDFAGLLRPRHRLCDVVEIEWLPDGRLAFESRTHKFPLPEPQARAFRRLCDILIFNYPAFLRHPGEMRDLQSASPTLDVWQLERTARGHELWWSPVEGVQVSAGLVASASEATKAARHLSGCATLRFWPHVWLDEVRSLWRPRPRPTAAAPAPATPITPTEERGRADVEARVQRWRDIHPAIADALETLDWSDLLTIPGAPTTQCLLLHRMKGARLTGWARPQDAIGCPHCPSAGPGGGRLDHIMWTCPMAQRLWTALRARWTHLYSAKMRWTERALLDNVFELHLKYMPDLLWEHRELIRLPRPNTADLSATQQAVQAIWRLQVLATLHVIWKWRNDADTMEMLWNPAQGTAYHDGCMRATLVDPRWRRTADSAASCHTAAAVEILRLADPQRDFAPAQASPTTDQQYILFFDGGSRGNPGPGGSGAVVVRASHHATRASIVWSAATSAAQATTTNNQAEYAGVVAGLRAAHSNDWTPIEVVGDSQFILRQLREFRPPKNPALSVLYAEARRLGDILGICRWTHHLREYNKMADAAANLAMDSKASSQVLHPTTRAAHAALQQHLASDFAHWQATFFSRSDST